MAEPTQVPPPPLPSGQPYTRDTLSGEQTLARWLTLSVIGLVAFVPVSTFVAMILNGLLGLGIPWWFLALYLVVGSVGSVILAAIVEAVFGVQLVGRVFDQVSRFFRIGSGSA